MNTHPPPLVTYLYDVTKGVTSYRRCSDTASTDLECEADPQKARGGDVPEGAQDLCAEAHVQDEEGGRVGEDMLEAQEEAQLVLLRAQPQVVHHRLVALRKPHPLDLAQPQGCLRPNLSYARGTPTEQSACCKTEYRTALAASSAMFKARGWLMQRSSKNDYKTARTTYAQEGTL